MLKSNIQEIERGDSSIVKLLKIMKSIHSTLLEHQVQGFLSLKVKGQLAEMCKSGFVEEFDKFSAEINSMYSTCSERINYCKYHDAFTK